MLFVITLFIALSYHQIEGYGSVGLAIAVQYVLDLGSVEA